jgi:hypothetical protein
MRDTARLPEVDREAGREHRKRPPAFAAPFSALGLDGKAEQAIDDGNDAAPFPRFEHPG